ncbi:uncharacterized protein A1O9_03252 [Exophiala aquamarina CBS 119918]|uniref:Mitochondrial mRNA processing protein PET127 n=1 Tax=Exophiala aquamarina CBS 119918 TaxID=1182545 RepID=A0A072PNM9_9EURO|nr:uncharacterized protein A1O9_03252 [Exophiala aquamarina CBS 119918]KEF61684.1 hypothetical protein A1O9_03252 [Exophiala aquamarina CBS 119918]
MLATAGREANLRHHGYNNVTLSISRSLQTPDRRPFSRLYVHHGTSRQRPQVPPCEHRARILAIGGTPQQHGYASQAAVDQVVLETSQREEVALFKDVGKQLRKAWLDVDPKGDKAIPFQEVLKASGIKSSQNEQGLQHIVERIEHAYAGKKHWYVNSQLSILPNPKKKDPRIRHNSAMHNLLRRLGIIRGDQAPRVNEMIEGGPTSRKRVMKPLVRRVAPLQIHKLLAVDRKLKKLRNEPIQPQPEPRINADISRIADVSDYHLQPIPAVTPEVPRLSYDLSRVLFNPGVYQLQDPRSRVWNFDPYLGKIIPVSEFNFNALNKYITSSQDDTLREMALKLETRYTGSTSSMSGILAHFHYLLSDFRPLTMENMSRGFRENYDSFTKLQRGPSAIFLRWRDGIYAVDADKEFDSANILMSLGRSMEKLFTSEKKDFEMFRKTAETDKNPQADMQEREAYHYTQLGQFLLRSQLDCFDPRLPGTGIFDLKTRAVAGVRMMLLTPEEGQGYQIKERFGTWESYEREYYDMMRSAFLKYSLQVRMGRMDGIFVAYHNVERIFGFQYVSLPEMDLALHGQTDPSLGDREYRLSLKILSDIFDRATEAYPETSIRFHFESREATKVSPSCMYVFAEPVSEDEVRNIQTAKRDEIEAYERRLFNPTTASQASTDDGQTAMSHGEDPSNGPGQHPITEDVAFLENMMGVEKEDRKGSSEPVREKEILAWKLHIRNSVNGKVVQRPENLRGSHSWEVEYSLEPQSKAMGHRNYLLCKNRRKAVLEFPQAEDKAAGFYIQQLVEMSRAGKMWRRKLDEFDAQREQVVLYQGKG